MRLLTSLKSYIATKNGDTLMRQFAHFNRNNLLLSTSHVGNFIPYFHTLNEASHYAALNFSLVLMKLGSGERL